MIPAIIALLSVLCAFFCLARLAVIDFQVRLLPNTLNLGLAVSGAVFHLATFGALLPPEQAVYGCLFGGLSFLFIRHLANLFYEDDALGLGDVKLMAAGGIWLGTEGILLAMASGAFASLVISVCYLLWRRARFAEPLRLMSLKIPAGPGFVLGILLSGIWVYRAPLALALNFG